MTLGLVRRPFWRDPLLALLVGIQVLVQIVLPLPGDTVETVGEVTRTYNTSSTAVLLWERMFVGLVIAVLLWLPAVLARRSRNRWRGRPTRPGGLLLLWDAPWHRDPVWWVAGVLGAMSMAAAPGLSSFGEESSGPGELDRSREVVTGSYLDLLPFLPELALGVLVLAAVLGLARLVFRLLGGQRPGPLRKPSRTRRPTADLGESVR